MKPLICLLVAMAAPALAQTSVTDLFAEMALDLNGNGVNEVYSLIRNGDGDADLVVRGDPDVNGAFPSLVWAGGMFGTTPSLG